MSTDASSGPGSRTRRLAVEIPRTVLRFLAAAAPRAVLRILDAAISNSVLLLLPAAVASTLLLFLAAAPVSAQTKHATDTKLVCSDCHSCDHPSKTRPCLKEGICPRHQAMADLPADMGPDVALLDELENLYEPVRFQHKAHAQMVRFSGGCETCHHFTPPNADHPACKDCHPKEILLEDLAQPGLKGAYHRSCMKCHTEWDQDTACEVCHAKKGQAQLASDFPHGHYKQIELEELILFDTDHAEGDQVPFHHRNHSVLYERDCTECHQAQSCEKCHVQGEAPHPMGRPAETNLHETCFRCHREEPCSQCHGRDPDDLFTHASTGWPLQKYHSGLRCRSCHGQRGAFMKLEPRCENCHPQGWDAATFNHQVTGVRLDETHVEFDCTDCHTKGVGSGADCSGCHDDGRTYQTAKGFAG
jgi:hypothetical protein